MSIRSIIRAKLVRRVVFPEFQPCLMHQFPITYMKVMDELANISALYNEAKADLDASKADQNELNDLREMKEDIERKEKQQAAIIENQVRVWLHAKWVGQS